MKQKQLALAEETEQIENQTLLLLKDLRMAQRTDITRYPEEYEQLISNALRTAEEVTCSIRHVMYNSGHKKSELMAQASQILGITVEQEPQWLKVVLPVLLQRRKRNMNVEFLNDPLYYALDIILCARRVLSDP